MKTPVGITEYSDTGPGVAQGSSEGALISAANLDNSLKEVFHEEDLEDKEGNDQQKDKSEGKRISYEGITIYSLRFQDDVLDPEETIEDAQKANT